MAQTVQRKQKRKQPAAIEPQDSTPPPAPKRVRVSQTARKSTGGREPPRRGRGGDDGEDAGGDDRRPGPSRQRM